MKSKLLLHRLARFVVCIIISFIVCLFFTALIGIIQSSIIYSSLPELSMDNEMLMSIILLSSLVPAPLGITVIIALAYLAIIKRHWKIFDRTSSAIKLGVIIGLVSTILLYPLHKTLFPMGIYLTPFH